MMRRMVAATLVVAPTFLLSISSIMTMVSAFFYVSAFSPSTTTTRRNRFRSPLVATSHPSSSSSTTTTTAREMVYDVRDADFGEMVAGGQRYEMIPLPDSMVDTTVFVGNLCEFANDDDLQIIFSKVSSLQSVPAIVARKPNMNSLQYGFVSFPTVEEKEVGF